MLNIVIGKLTTYSSQNEVSTLRAAVYGRPAPIFQQLYAPLPPLPVQSTQAFDYMLQSFHQDSMDQAPVKLENLSYSLMPQDSPNLKGQIFGIVSPEGQISNEM